jgi:hypothetical protein
MSEPYSGLGHILENHVLPMVRAGNMSKGDLSLLNDCASQTRRTLTTCLKIMGKGFVCGEQERFADEEHFLYDLGQTLVAMAEGIEALVQIEKDTEDFKGNAEAMRLLYAALKPQEEATSA